MNLIKVQFAWHISETKDLELDAIDLATVLIITAIIILTVDLLIKQIANGRMFWIKLQRVAEIAIFISLNWSSKYKNDEIAHRDWLRCNFQQGLFNGILYEPVAIFI